MDRAYRGDRYYDGRNSYDPSMNPRRGHPDDRGPWNQSSRGGYSRRDRSNSAPRRPSPGPIRRPTAQEINPRPKSPVTMPSPVTSPSEIDADPENRQTDKRLEKATDSRRRAKVGSSTSALSPLETPQSPATPSLANATLPAASQTGTQIPKDPDRDMEMADTDLSTYFQQLAQSLAEFGDLNMQSGAQFGIFQRLEEQYAEKRRAKEVAVEKFKDHPEYSKHVTLQESTAHAEFEKASKTKAELKSAVQNHASQFVSQLSATIHNLLDKKSTIPSSAIEKLQADLETIRSDLPKQNPALPSEVLDLMKRSSDVVQSFRKALDSRMTEVENTVKSLKSAVTTQVKAELSEALRQIQIKSTSALTDCQTVKADILETMKSSDKSQAKLDGDVQQLREENTKLRQEIANLKVKDILRDQEIATLKARTISRNEFEKFKADMEKLRQAPAENSASAAQPNAAALLEPYVNSYKKDIQSLTTQVESNSSLIQTVTARIDSITPEVSKAQVAAQFGTERLDSFHQSLGALRNQIGKLETQPPASTATPSSAALVLVQKENEANNLRLAAAEKELMALGHANRALNSRYNNMTSEPLAQHIAAIVNPINANALVDLAHTKQAVSQLQQQQADLRGTVTRFSQRVDNTEAKAGATSAAAGAISKLESRVKTVELAAVGIPNIHNAFSKHQTQYSEDYAGVMAMAQSRQEEVDKIKKDLTEQDARQKKLSLKIDEHLNDELVTLQEDVTEVQKGLKNLNQSVKDTTEKLDEVQTTLQTLKSEQEKDQLADGGLQGEFDMLKDDVQKEKGLIRERISSLADTVKGLETKMADGERVRDTSGPLVVVEKAVKDLQSTVKEHSARLEAMDGDILNSFMANRQSFDQNNITTRTPTIVSTPPSDTSPHVNGITGKDSGKDTNVDTKPVPSIPTGPRDLSTPISTPLKPPISRGTSASIPSKRRNHSPYSATTRKKTKRMTDWPSGDSIDLTQDDDDLDGPPMMGGHTVSRGRKVTK